MRYVHYSPSWPRVDIVLTLPELSLYIHIPWCVQKCPYCDFNSHGQKQQALPEQEYLSHLKADLLQDLGYVQGRKLHSIFIGGGTPSLFSPEVIGEILAFAKQHIGFVDDIEITLEANPGTVEADKFAGFKAAGVTRFSIGVQSLQQDKLQALGRIHGPEEALRAAQHAHSIGIPTFNMDLMHGLPNQSLADALADLRLAADQQPPHLSWYQLTIEPNTLFYSKPPTLPEDDTLWDIQEQGHQLLTELGYQQYETSAYAKPGQQCRHNLNYWRFGDYLGIGCGAHGKVSLPEQNRIIRTEKIKHPKGYMDLQQGYLLQQHQVDAADRPFEFFMNQFRLLEACPKPRFSERTGLAVDVAEQLLKPAVRKGLVDDLGAHWQVTALGQRYLNELLEMLME